MMVSELEGKIRFYRKNGKWCFQLTVPAWLGQELGTAHHFVVFNFGGGNDGTPYTVTMSEFNQDVDNG